MLAFMAKFEDLYDPDEGVVGLLMSKLVSTEITGRGDGLRARMSGSAT